MLGCWIGGGEHCDKYIIHNKRLLFTALTHRQVIGINGSEQEGRTVGPAAPFSEFVTRHYRAPIKSSLSFRRRVVKK